MKRTMVLALMLWPFAVGAVVDPATLDDPDQDARYRQLIAEIRCLVCQNQTLADSNAPLAVDLREQVREMVEAGATDDEIVAYLTARYGDFVLYRPPFNATTALLWLSPGLFLLIGGVIGWRVLWARRRVATDDGSGQVDESTRSRVKALLEDPE